MTPGDNTEKKWARRFLAKQKTDVPKARKMVSGGLGSAVRSPRSVLVLFRLKHGKTAIVKVKIRSEYLSNRSVQLTVNFASVKFTSVNHNLQLFFEINHKDCKNRNVEQAKTRSKGERKYFTYFQYGFRSSQSTADLLTVVSDRIARAFSRSGATRPVALEISKAFDMLVFFTNLSLMEFQVKYLALFLLFLVISGFRLFWMGNLHKNIQLMLVFLKGIFLVLHFSC